MKRIATLVLPCVLSVVMPSIVFAQASDVGKKESSGMNMKDMGMNNKAVATTHHGVGIVKDINVANGVVTLAHEPIKSLNWPAMTMGFKVKDKTLLDNVKPGSKVDFTLVQAGKDYVVTSIKCFRLLY
jgi:Cu(I)/Ag(I) efflux system protein CusF